MPKTPTDTRLAFGGPTMGTHWSVLIDGPVSDPTVQSCLQAAVDEIDSQMSTWTPESTLMRLNRAPLDIWVHLPDRLLTVLEAGLAISRQTDGAFEMNMGDAVRAWGFGPDPPLTCKPSGPQTPRSGFRPPRRWSWTGPTAAPANRPHWRLTCPASPRATGWTALPKPHAIWAWTTHSAPSTARFGPLAPDVTGGLGQSRSRRQTTAPWADIPFWNSRTWL